MHISSNTAWGLKEDPSFKASTNAERHVQGDSNIADEKHSHLSLTVVIPILMSDVPHLNLVAYFNHSYSSSIHISCSSQLYCYKGFFPCIIFFIKFCKFLLGTYRITLKTIFFQQSFNIIFKKLSKSFSTPHYSSSDVYFYSQQPCTESI